jgi:putative nucleotidyltransferase with HDIG domain
LFKATAWRPRGKGGPAISLVTCAANSLVGVPLRPILSTPGLLMHQDSHDPHEETRHRVRELEAIFAISTALRLAKNDEDMIPILLDKTMEVLNAQHGAVVLWESAASAYSVRLGRGCLSQSQGVSLPADVRIQGQPIDLTCPYLTGTLATDLRGAGLEGDGMGPGILMPMRSSSETLGFMLIGRHLPVPFETEDADILTAITEMAGNALHRVRLHKELEESYVGTVLALANAVDAKDTYTGDHSARLAELALAVGHELGIQNGFLEDLRWGAMLHDIGKIGVPDQILRKPTPLTEEEWSIVRQHPTVGAQILSPVPKLAGAARIVRCHHERYNGGGYPDGLAAGDIPLGGRILAVVDAYGAITDERAYKRSRGHHDAIAELLFCSGTQFDPAIVNAFIRAVK